MTMPRSIFIVIQLYLNGTSTNKKPRLVFFEPRYQRPEKRL